MKECNYPDCQKPLSEYKRDKLLMKLDGDKVILYIYCDNSDRAKAFYEDFKGTSIVIDKAKDRNKE